MQKVTAFLEKYVQWIAIGLGGVYLIWMVWAYLLNTKATDVSVGGTPMAPGKVDNYILNNVADPLANRIKGAKTVNFPVPDPSPATNLNGDVPPPLATNWINSQTKPVALPSLAPAVNPNNPAQPGVGAITKVIELPKPPVPTDLATAIGRSSVVIPPQQVNAVFQQAIAAPPPAAGGAAPPPAAQPPQNPQAIAAGTLGPNGQPIVAGTDIDWVTVSYKIKIADLAAEFARCNIPVSQQGQSSTCFLDVQLHRQEQLPSGQWGNDVIVPKLTNSDQPPVPDQKKGTRPIFQAYLNWATNNLTPLIHPMFYQIVQGDPWVLPTDLVGATVVAGNQVLTLGPKDLRPGFDPNQYITMTQAQLNAVSPALTPAEKQAIAAAKDKKRAVDAAAARAKAHTAAAPRSGSRGVGGLGGLAQPAPIETGRPGAGRPLAGPGAGENFDAGGDTNPAQQQAQTPQQQNYSQMFPLPQQGDFDPRTLSATAQGQPTIIVGWAHDATAQPGKTYRYAVSYKIKSPVWGTTNATKPQTLANQFAIASDNSEWTAAVVVPPVVRFYFASSSGSMLPVEVYRWQDGVYHKAIDHVSPGDMIGKVVNGADFTTNFTVVDFRSDRDNTVAWLLNPDGQLVRRDCKADANSAELSQMRKLYEQQQSQLQPQPGQPAAGPVNTGGATPTPALINPGRSLN